MKILVLNGSPKGDNSITLQSILYLRKRFDLADIKIINVGAKVNYYVKNFEELIEDINQAELIIFSYPVYTFLAPYQLHRIIELMTDNKVDLTDKCITQITTSKHFYDMTAHRFVMDNCLDMNANYIRGLSADMDDLTLKKGREELEQFWLATQFCFENQIFTQKTTGDNRKNPNVYIGDTTVVEKTQNNNIVVIADMGENDISLANMLEQFVRISRSKVKVINIRDYPFKGGCLGCFRCVASEKCVYKDGFDEFLRKEIQTADAIVYAFCIKNHSMGSRFKLYDDRQFCNGHRPVTAGIPTGYIISGAYSAEENLRTVIEGRAEVGRNHLAYVATDENNATVELEKLDKAVNYAINNHILMPANFYGVGGAKIFRDLVYQMRGLMRADHKFYKAKKLYDFPQKKVGTILKMKLVGGLMTNPKIMEKAGKYMNEGMLMPYTKVIKDLDKK